MKRYISTYKTYDNFVKFYKTDRIKKFEKLSYNKKIPTSDSIKEIFNSDVKELDFELKMNSSQHVKNDSDYTYYFKSKSNNTYRLDLIKFKEDNTNIKNFELHDKVFISISYTLSDRNSENYDDLTDLNEPYDLLMRVKFLIKDYKNNYMKNDEVFMFGKPQEQKTNIYKYILKYCFPDCKLLTDHASLFDGNLGFYILE